MLKDDVIGLLGRILESDEFDPRFKKPNRVSDAPLASPVVQARETIPMKPLSLSELEGYPYLTTMSDRTAAGGQLVGVGDKSLAYPVNLTGGQDFMRDFTQNPNLWASAEGVVPKMVTAARELESEYGRQPVFMPWSMTPTGSDFSGMTGKTMFSYASENMPQTFKKEVDAHMKLYVPDWKGIDNPESGAQFDALPDKARKKVQGYMDTKFRNVGGITLPQTRIAIADQSQLNQPVMGFKNVGLIDTSVDALAGAGNPTYPSALAGEYMGTLDTDVTAIDLNPNRYARKRNADGSFFEDPQGKDYLSMKKAPRRSMETNYYGGLIDEPLLRDLEDRGFKVKSGLLPTAATLGVGAMGLLGSEEADAAPSMLKSIALDAMAEVPRKSPTSYTGWKKALNKAGVKDDELKQMGFKREFEYRQRSQDITRQEVEDFLAENQYNIREETLRKRKVFGEVEHDPELNTYNAVMPDRRDDEIFHTRQFAEDYVARNPITVNDSQYGPYTLTGGDNVNYREILLMDGPEADAYQALTKQINELENEITEGIGAPAGYLASDATMIFDEGSAFKEPYDRLRKLREERNRLPQPFVHQHYDDKENILSHLRVADRDLEDGSSTLMVEEIQSDLHQRGQEVGYAKAQDLKGVEDQLEQVNQAISGLKAPAVKRWAEENTPDLHNRTYGGEPNQEEFTALRQQMRDAFNQDYKARTGKDVDAEFDRLADIRDRLKAKQLSTMKAAPEMPFKSDDKSSWYDLAFKRSLMEAADGDYDSISFTTGQQQVDRYGESAEGGVKTFYDKTLPNHINKWAKQYGVKLERKPIRVGEKDYSVDTYDDGSYYVRNEEGGIIEDFDSLEEAEAYIKDKHEIQDVYTLKIPEKMRKDIREKGMPLFAQTGLTIGGATAASGLLSPKAQANEARMQGLLSDSEMRQEVVKGAAVVPDLTAGLVEQFGRDLVNFTAGTINPDYGDIAEGSVFPVTEGGKATLSKAGEAFMKYAAPTLAKGVNSLLDFEPMIGPTARDQMKFVAQQYEKLPESVKEEVTPRLGYAGLLAMTAVPAGKAVKKTIKKRKKN
jgi:hypothetical protein